MKITKGELCWFDIPVKDFTKAKTFYSKLLGWKYAPMGEEYWLIKVGNEMIGGLRHNTTAIKPGDLPIMYFTVPKLAPATALAKKLGAAIVGTRVDIPDDMGCFQLIRDKDKNLIGLWSLS